MIWVDRWAVTLLVLGALAIGCGNPSKPSPSGALDIVVVSDMALPKDLDRIRVQVTQDGQTLFAQESDVGPDAQHLPATFEVNAPSNPSPVSVQAVGYKNGDARVERDAVTPIPSSYVGQLRLALNFVCVGTATTDSDGTVRSTCAAGQTCVNGACQTANVPTPPKATPAAEAGDAGSTETGTSMPEGCFDVTTCFADPELAAVSSKDCRVTLPAGWDAATLNLGIELPLGSAGICDKTACFIALTGWTQNGGTVDLPPSVCQQASSQGGQIVISNACNTEPDGAAVCGDWSSVATPIPEPTPGSMSPIGSSCGEPKTQSCGLCGTQSRECMNGGFGPWGACTKQGVCEPGVTQSCGGGGSRSCSDACQWGSCECAADELSCGKAGDCRDPSDVHTCGACQNDCSALPNIVPASADCSTGQCAYQCKAGFADCGDGNGCTTDLSRPTSCGTCQNDCSALPNVVGVTTCSAGQCGLSAASCAPGYGDCNGNPSDGCELPVATADHCGDCSTSCSGATPFCDSSQGAPHCVSTCGNTTCGSDCVDLSTNPADCGACGTVCPSSAHGQASCNGSQCGLTCSANYMRCTGACVDTTSDVKNCGGCNASCSLANATASCKSGSCAIATCATGFADCDGNAANGCETNLNTDSNHCGACPTKCTGLANATASCSAGHCALSGCSSGFDDCDGSASDGCEVNLNTDANHCGKCSSSCSLANATASCKSGSCAIATCSTGFDDCDGNAANGCETNLNIDSNHCGKCATKCSGLANANTTCSAGQCVVSTCASGFEDCNGDKSDGCEVNLNTDANHCGKCSSSCSLANATAACQSGSCAVSSCTTGFDNCDGGPGNGCETDLSSDANHCGSCATKCGTLANATSGCSAKKCGVASCNSGYGDCNSSPTDGCEATLNTDAKNCGKCNNPCSLANATASCKSGSCAVSTCSAGFDNCDGNAANGCEAKLNSDSNNCGACNVKCGTGTSCQNGLCRCSGNCPTTKIATAFQPVGIAADAKNVYWTDLNTNGTYTYPGGVAKPPNSGVVMQAPIGGGTPIMIAWNMVTPEAIAVDSTSVYWINRQTGQIFKAPIGGGVTPTSLNSGGVPSHGLALSAGSIFWTNTENVLHSVPISGATTANSLNSLGQGSYGGFAVDASNVYFLSASVYKQPLSTPSQNGVELISAGLTNPFAIAVDGSNVYYANFSTATAEDALMRVPIGGGAAVVVASEQQDIIDLAADGTAVYWTSLPAGKVLKLPAGGSAPIALTTLPSGQVFPFFNFPLGLALNANNVFYTSESSAQSPGAGTGAIMMVSK